MPVTLGLDPLVGHHETVIVEGIPFAVDLQHDVVRVGSVVPIELPAVAGILPPACKSGGREQERQKHSQD